jgi:hypothetical protein
MTCELPKVCIRKKVKARKSHVCCECKKTISPKSLYFKYSGIWDKPATFKCCLKCDKLRDLALKKYPPELEDEGPAFGLLFDWIKTNHG